MYSSGVRFIVDFIVLIVVQLLILDEIDLGQYFHPVLFYLPLLTVPFNFNKSLALIIAFIIGITVDLFNHTAGLHTATILLIAYIRPHILSLLAPRDGYELNKLPVVQNMGIKWTVIYLSIPVFTYNVLFFTLELFKFSFFEIIQKTFFSSFLSLSLMLLYQFLTFKPQRSV